MKPKFIISNAVLLLPILMYLLFGESLPQQLIIHFGPGGVRYTSLFNALVLVPLLFFVFHQVIWFKPDWLGRAGKTRRIYLMPVISLVFFGLTFYFSR